MTELYFSGCSLDINLSGVSDLEPGNRSSLTTINIITIMIIIKMNQ